MAQWSLRVRHAGGQATLSLAAGGETTWGELQQLIAEKAGVQPHAQEVLAGFPPKPVQVKERQHLLQDAHTRMHACVAQLTTTD